METRQQDRGFTLIEMLLIAPLVIILIGVMVGLITTLTGQGLQIWQKNSFAYNTQAALDNIEQSASRASNFLENTGTLVSPQGLNDSTTAFANSSSPNTLIFTAAATTKGPYDNNRSLVYVGSPCDPSNTVYLYTTVYYVNAGSLYKRTILPTTSTACTPPYQRNSCSPAVMASASPPAICKVEDEKLLDNVSALSVAYYSGTGIDAAVLPASSAQSADNVSVTITTLKQSARSTITYTGTVRVKAVNADTRGS